jgi:hypothetical protein
MTERETPTEKAERLSQTYSDLVGGPVGMADCGCPNNMLGAPPALHICRACGFEGNYDIHQDCPCCAYLRHGGTSRDDPRSPEFRLWGPSE